jgi:hypothetical protein
VVLLLLVFRLFVKHITPPPRPPAEAEEVAVEAEVVLLLKMITGSSVHKQKQQHVKRNVKKPAKAQNHSSVAY